MYFLFHLLDIIHQAVLNQALYAAKLMVVPGSAWQADFCSVAKCSGQVSPSTIIVGSMLAARLLSSWPDLEAAAKPVTQFCVWSALVMQLM